MGNLTLGIDDSGRGPLIGPMILAGVLLDKNGETFLKKYTIKDSKMLAHPVRIKLSKIIKESALAFHITKSSPQEIDSSIKKGTNLNTLEAQKTAEIINALNTKKDVFTFNPVSGVFSKLNKEEIETLEKITIKKEEVLYYIEAKGKRNKASYSTQKTFDLNEAEFLRTSAIKFVNKVKEIIDSTKDFS